MSIFGFVLLNVSARQTQTAASTSTRPSMNLQHGVFSGLRTAPTGITGMPSTSAHSTFIFVVSLGQVSVPEGGDISPGIEGRFGIGGKMFGIGGSRFGIGGIIFGIGGKRFGIGGKRLGIGGNRFGN
ncbi:hypothetical protein AgCh_040097 [Apium graveolens]